MDGMAQADVTRGYIDVYKRQLLCRLGGIQGRMEILAAYGCGYVAGHSLEGVLEYFQRFVVGIAINDYKEIKDTVPAVSKTFSIFA